MQPLIDQMASVVARVVDEEDDAGITTYFRSPLWHALTLLCEATPEMIAAANVWSRDAYGKPIGNAAAADCWRAMMKALLSDPASPPSVH